MNRSYDKRLLLAAAVALITSYFLIRNFSIGPSESLLSFFDGTYLNAETNPFLIILLLLPSTLFLYLWGDFFKSDFESMCVYIFTRTKNRTKWLIKKVLILFSYWLAFYLIYAVSMFVLLAVKNKNFFFLIKEVPMLLWIVLWNVLMMFPILLLENLLSIKIAPVKCVSIVILLHLISLSLLIMSPNALLFILPSVQAVYQWHFSVLPNFTILYSVFYFLIIITVELSIGTVQLKRIDLI
jgi:hypothetical protein